MITTWVTGYVPPRPCPRGSAGAHPDRTQRALPPEVNSFSWSSRPFDHKTLDKNTCKNTLFRDIPSISRTWIFFFLTLLLSYLLSELLSLLSDVPLCSLVGLSCCFFVRKVGSLTSKLPSINNVPPSSKNCLMALMVFAHWCLRCPDSCTSLHLPSDKKMLPKYLGVDGDRFNMIQQYTALHTNLLVPVNKMPNHACILSVWLSLALN